MQLLHASQCIIRQMILMKTDEIIICEPNISAFSYWAKNQLNKSYLKLFLFTHLLNAETLTKSPAEAFREFMAV